MSKKSSAKRKKSSGKSKRPYTKSSAPKTVKNISKVAEKAPEEISTELGNTLSEDWATVAVENGQEPLNSECETATTAHSSPNDIENDTSFDIQEHTPESEPEKEPENEPEDKTEQESDSKSQYDSQNENTNGEKTKKARIILKVLLIIVIIILLPIAGILTYGALPHRTEIGESIRLPLKELPFFSSNCEIKTDLDSIDTSTLGEHPLELEFFGFIPVKSTLIVRDSTEPIISTHPLCIPSGAEVSAKEFISSADDRTGLTYTLRGKVDTENGGTVKLRATDECGNKTSCTAELVISDLLSCHEIELGTKRFDLTFELLKNGHLSELDYSDVNFSECGTYPVRGNLDGIRCLFYVTIVDTTSPSAEALSHDILLGTTLEVDDFVSKEFDRSETKKHFEEAPDFEKLGKQPITVILEDTFGNTSRVNAVLSIHDIAYSYTVEAGTSSEAFSSELVPKNNVGSYIPYLPEDVFVEQLHIGTHEISLQGEYSMIPIELNVIDTIAPSMTLKPTDVFLGTEPNAANFVESVEDASEVTFSFSGNADTSLLGEHTVTIIATDAAGNFTSVGTTMRVIKDTTKPVIYGVKPLAFSEGETVSYRNGVYAVDDCDGDVTVNVDSSRVNTSIAGVYYIVYSASDSSGNTATASTTVTIGAVSRKHVDDLADRVIAKIITSSMTQREKAEAIYKWCAVNIRYSSLTAHLMGNFNQAAYTGLTKHYGNCYTYYAVASALLSRVGIENIEIHRNDPNRPHYWNLVKMDGAWYHFDTCPQPAPHRLRVFLLTDSQVHTFPLDYYYSFDTNNYPATP